MSQNPREAMMRILTRRIRPSLRMIAEEVFEDAKLWLLNAVEEADLSRDLRSHASSPRLGGSSTGTLFGFMGFPEGSDPVGELIHFLENTIQFRENPQGENRLFSASVYYPDKGSFSSLNFKLPWTDRGWPVMVEEGISGLPFYLNKPWAGSISGEGFQSKRGEVRGADFQPEQYLTPLFSEFRQRLLLKR